MVANFLFILVLMLICHFDIKQWSLSFFWTKLFKARFLVLQQREQSAPTGMSDFFFTWFNSFLFHFAFHHWKIVPCICKQNLKLSMSNFKDLICYLYGLEKAFCLWEFVSISSLQCQLDVSSTGFQTQNELGQLVRVTGILWGKSTQQHSVGAKTPSSIKCLWSV